MKGAPFEIVPKRRSQMACGIPDSRASQGLFTASKKLACVGFPFGVSKDAEKGAEDQFLFVLGKTREEGVIEASCCAISSPP